ncbi:MAG: ATP-binding protein [Flavobacteriales bacterium]|jgi:signal transduction histidine kinase
MSSNPEFHRLFQRQLKKFNVDIEELAPNVREFLSSLNSSYLHMEENRLLVERAMRLSSEELEEKNKRLHEESQKQQVLIESLKTSFKSLSTGGEEINDDNLIHIAEQIKVAIKERKKIEKDLVKAREVAEASLETRKIFLANISHEVRTPLNAIIGMSGVLADSDLNSEQLEYLEAIRASSEGLLVIINDILDLTKMESGKLQLEQIPFSIDHALKPVMRGFGVKAQQKNIQLTIERDVTIPDYLKGDPTRLVQVLSNLISNSIKFTNEGSVKLIIRNKGNEKDNYLIQFTVVDTGVGIDENKISAIFDEFTQEDASISRRYGGTGLGLPIAKNLVEIMGGTLDVESIKNKGSAFSFTLSLVKIEKPTVSDIGIGIEKDLSGKKILLIEDNEINRFLASTLLKKWNATYSMAVNGIDAIHYLQKENFDVILMDLQMPEEDGFQSTHRIRNTLNLKTPIIALTANALESERQACLKAGMNDYLSKPYAPDDLYSKIVKHIVN